MTRLEAEQRCTELHATGERDVRWMPRQRSAGDWTVVRLRVPGLPTTEPVGTAQESRPRPGPADTRPLVNPYWGPG